MKRLVAFLLLVALCLAGCAGQPSQPATANPDAALLTGLWEQLISVESLPQEIALDASGSAVVDGESGHWRLDDGMLYLRSGGSESVFSCTVSGYMMTLNSASADASDFYINPALFSAGAGSNAALAGQWAAFSTFGMMAFDGADGLDSIVYTTAGRTVLKQKYAALDGILQTVDTGGNYTYNLYDFSAEGALLLAETTEYDRDERQWTAYWKKANPEPGLVGDWSLAFDTQPGSAGLPAALKLRGDGTGSAEQRGAAASDIRWEYYSGGFVVLLYSDTYLQYAWSGVQGGVLSLGNPDVDEAWYTDESRYRPTVAGLQEILGTWKAGDSSMELRIGPGNFTSATNDSGMEAQLSASSADSLLKLENGGETYYIAYSVDDGTMRIYYGNVPFFDAKEMPASLTKQ
jgi:hypothetical protein